MADRHPVPIPAVRARPRTGRGRTGWWWGIGALPGIGTMIDRDAIRGEDHDDVVEPDSCCGCDARDDCDE